MEVFLCPRIAAQGACRNAGSARRTTMRRPTLACLATTKSALFGPLRESHRTPARLNLECRPPRSQLRLAWPQALHILVGNGSTLGAICSKPATAGYHRAMHTVYFTAGTANPALQLTRSGLRPPRAPERPRWAAQSRVIARRASSIGNHAPRTTFVAQKPRCAPRTAWAARPSAASAPGFARSQPRWRQYGSFAVRCPTTALRTTFRAGCPSAGGQRTDFCSPPPPVAVVPLSRRSLPRSRVAPELPLGLSVRWRPARRPFRPTATACDCSSHCAAWQYRALHFRTATARRL
jgi:hypothetical protein